MMDLKVVQLWPELSMGSAGAEQVRKDEIGN